MRSGPGYGSVNQMSMPPDDRFGSDAGDWRSPGSSKPEKRYVSVVPASMFDGMEVPPRRWLVKDMVPAGTVTTINGDGGTGKSLLAAQLALATTSNTKWVGQEVEQGSCIYLSAEDDLDELHRRVATIAERQGVPLARLHNFHIVPLAGEDAILASTRPGSHVLSTTALFEAIEGEIQSLQPALVILDTLADLFGGEENQRAQSRQFIGLLRRWAIKYHLTIVLLAHPSLSGMANGSGSSGSTGWNNSVRSRLYLERVMESSGVKAVEPDPDARVLRTVKANYGRTGGEIPLRWSNGILVPDISDLGVDLRNALTEQRAEKAFLNMVQEFAAEGRHVSATPSANYAPSVFAKDARSDGMSKRSLVEAMNRLFATRKIEVKEDGPLSRRRSFICIRPTN
jgi:RecA-family ATPase